MTYDTHFKTWEKNFGEKSSQYKIPIVITGLWARPI